MKGCSELWGCIAALMTIKTQPAPAPNIAVASKNDFAVIWRRVISIGWSSLIPAL
jgi:hypothetical protein